MTAEPMTVQPPKHPMHALTTYELSRYRRELEHALNLRFNLISIQNRSYADYSLVYLSDA